MMANWGVTLDHARSSTTRSPAPSHDHQGRSGTCTRFVSFPQVIKRISGSSPLRTRSNHFSHQFNFFSNSSAPGSDIQSAYRRLNVLPHTDPISETAERPLEFAGVGSGTTSCRSV